MKAPDDAWLRVLVLFVSPFVVIGLLLAVVAIGAWVEERWRKR